MTIIDQYPCRQRGLPQTGFPRPNASVYHHAMTRISSFLSAYLGISAACLVATTPSAQGQSASAASSSAGYDTAKLTITPRRPEIGSLVLLSFRRSSAPGD